MVMQRLSIPEPLDKIDTSLTVIEEQFNNIITNYEIYGMVKMIYPQYWINTGDRYRRVDFVLVIDDDPENQIGLFIEIDGQSHRNMEQRIKDQEREEELFSPSFPILRFSGSDVFRFPERVADQVIAKINILKG